MAEKSCRGTGSGVFRFPATPDGRQLLHEMLYAASVDSLPPDFEFDNCDFDDLAACVSMDQPDYEDWRREHGRGVE